MKEQEYQAEQQSLFSFDPITVVRHVLKRWYVIVVAALVVGMIGYIVSDAAYRPQYTTTTTYVASARDSTGNIYQNLNAAANLASVFTEVLNSNILRAEILKELEMDTFHGTIVATAIPETNLLTLRVTDTDARTAFLVTRCIIEKHHIVSYQVLGDTILEVLQEPVVPVAPTNPRNSDSFAKKAAIAAAVAVCVLLAVASFNRDAVRSRREAAEKLDCRCLGEIRHERKHKTLRAFLRNPKTSVLITKPATSFPFVEAVRKLRHQVENKMTGGKQVMLVTSVLENEGKSTVCANLALSLAMKGRKVLLIDCDLRKPACYRLLEKPIRGAGTLDVISGQQELMQAVTRDKLSGLHLLLEHRNVRTSTNLVGSEGMKRLLEEARRNFEIVLVDMPPMSAAPDSEAILEFVDGALLVVRQDAATAKQINRAIRALQDTKAELLGCVLNNVYSTAMLGHSSYGYGYGYAYGRYGKYGKYGNYGHYGSYGKYSGKYGMQGTQTSEQTTDQ